MNVSSYIFQSPYSGQVQVGRPDTSVQKESSSSESDDTSLTRVSTTAQEAPTDSTQVEEVQATTESTPLLDIYA